MQVSTTIRNVYLYAVCFATLIMMIISFSQVANGLFELAYPQPVSITSPSPVYKGLASPVTSEADQQKLAEQARAEQENQLQMNRYFKVRQVVEGIILILIALPIYIYHWRKVERGRVV